MTTGTKFEVGKTYSCRSICDHNCIFSFVIVSRTGQSVVIRSTTGGNLPMQMEVIGGARRKLRVREGVEEIDPLGRYSMAPILSASKLALAA